MTAPELRPTEGGELLVETDHGGPVAAFDRGEDRRLHVGGDLALELGEELLQTPDLRRLLLGCATLRLREYLFEPL